MNRHLITFLSVFAGLFVVGLFCSAAAMAQSGSRSAASSQGRSVAQAVGLAKKTGLPIFAVSVSDSCPACQALLKTLVSDTSLRPVLQQFVSLEIDVDNSDFRNWERVFPRKSNGIPGVYVVTSSGKQIFGAEGAMQGEAIKQMLLASLEKAGRLPDQATIDKLVAAAEIAEEHLDANRVEQALAELATVRREFLRFGASLEFSEDGQEARQVALRIEGLGRQQLKSVVQRSPDDPVWPAALSIARMEESYAILPDLKMEIDAAANQLASNTVNKKVLKQARDLVRAETLVKSGAKPEKAAGALRKIIKRYPNTQAAVEAAELLKKSTGAEIALAEPPAEHGSFRDWTDNSGKYSIRAELLETVDDRVRLRRKNGKVVTIEISRLDESARRYLSKQSP